MTAPLPPAELERLTKLRIEVAWFANGGEEGKPALGTPETLGWEELSDIVTNNRRVGAKDGCNLIPIRFKREPGKPRVVRRKAVNARARTAIALDIEENKATGELPPSVGDIVHRLQTLALAAIVWTTHSHTAVRPRYRVLVPLCSEIAPDLPAVEILAQRLNLDAVFDRSKRGPASLFYLPSAASFDVLDHHEAYAVAGEPHYAALMEKEAGDLLAERQAEEERVAAEAAEVLARTRRQCAVERASGMPAPLPRDRRPAPPHAGRRLRLWASAFVSGQFLPGCSSTNAEVASLMATRGCSRQ